MNRNSKHKFLRLLASLNLGYAVPLSLEEKLQHLQSDPNWTTLDLPIDGRIDRVEQVLVEKVGDNRYRLASSPGLIQGLAANDIIALDRQSPTGFALLQRGNNVCIHLFCDATQRDAVQNALVQTLGRIGGHLDGTMGTTGLCFTIPVQAGFTAIDGALQSIVGNDWSYSNVYDLQTNLPLNWWLKKSQVK